jgi:2-hydroxychromene-2-carboxylate isomerase
MPSPVDFWFEFGSTYSYLAASRVERLAHAAGIVVVWRPFLLGPIFGAQGWNDSPFNIYPVKGRYMWRDMERLCEAQGLPLKRPSQFPRNGLLAARVVCAAAGAPWVPEFVRSVYRANFGEDREVSRPEVVAELLQAQGLAADEWLARAELAETKQALRAQTERAIAHGIFGAPSFTVGNELFWGNDRLEQALDFAAGGAARAR